MAHRPGVMTQAILYPVKRNRRVVRRSYQHERSGPYQNTVFFTEQTNMHAATHHNAVQGDLNAVHTTSNSALIERVHCVEIRSEEHTSELQSRFDLVCRLLLEKKKKKTSEITVRKL